MQPEILGLGRSEFAASRPVARPDRPEANPGRSDIQRPGPGDGDAVKVTLSDEAKKRLAADEAASRPNTPAVPPAQQARADITAIPGLGDLSFGKVVSAIARQLDASGLLSQVSSKPTTPSAESAAASQQTETEQPSGSELKQPASRISILA